MTTCSKDRIIDIVIIGTGPAGLSAALYGARSGLKTVIYGDPYEGQLAKAGIVENFITWTDGPTGITLIEKMIEHATSFGADLRERKIKQIIKNPGGGFQLFDDQGDSICAHTVILTSGTKHRKLGAKGEEEYLGKGVGYCTICDGALYKNKPVAIVGFGEEAVLAALRMATMASSVNLVGTKSRIGADHSLIENLESFENVKIFENTRPIEILGGKDGNVAAYKFKHDNIEITIDVDAVFIEVGVLPSSAIASGLGLELEGNFIVADINQETKVKGFYAAGDITGGLVKQAIVSAGDGAKAAIGAIDYIKREGLSDKKLKTTQWGGTQKEKVVTKAPVSIDGNQLIKYVFSDDGFKSAFERYSPKTEIIEEVLAKMPSAKIITISAHWCPDCRRNVPRMAKISNHLKNGWETEALDRDAEGVIEKYNVRKIPTFIIQDKEGNEIARIIENPKFENLETDLLRIAEGNYN